MKILECAHCGNQVVMMHDAGVKMMCCGEPMGELQAGAKDAALEKHVPALSASGGQLDVVVGSVPHPMTPEHYIRWIGVEQGDKTQYVQLSPDSEPKASFSIAPGQPCTVYEYCNLHGLWKAET